MDPAKPPTPKPARKPWQRAVLVATEALLIVMILGVIFVTLLPIMKGTSPDAQQRQQRQGMRR